MIEFIKENTITTVCVLLFASIIVKALLAEPVDLD